MTGVSRLWAKLLWVSPSGDEEADDKRRLSALVIFVALALCPTFGLALLPLSLDPDAPMTTRVFQSVVALMFVFPVAFWLNRQRHDGAGATLFVAVSMATTVWSAVPAPNVLVFISIEMLLATTLMPLRAAVILGGAGLLGHLSPLSDPANGLEDLGLPFCLNATFLVMVVLPQAHHRARALRRRQEIERREHWFATTLGSIGDGVVTVAPTEEITYLNPRAAEMTGWSAEDAIGQSVHLVLRVTDEASGKLHPSPVHEAMRHPMEIETSQGTLVSRDGHRRAVYQACRALVDPDGRTLGAVLVLQDRTKEKEIEARLQHAQRLDSLGQLAGGVAHDFNNLLTVIGGSIDLAVNHSNAGGKCVDELRIAVQAIERAVGLTKQLLAFSRRQVLQPRVLDLRRAVRDTCDMLSRLLRDDVRLVNEASQEKLWVRVDPIQLEQVLLNLAINARDAMPQGGTLTLSTGRVAAEQQAGIDVVQSADYARLTVHDTGTGIAPEHLERLFEPFFTTKGTEGTGLGLATVYGIVQQSGGDVRVDSSPTEGTTFEVRLPLAKAPSGEAAAGHTSPKAVPDSERVLVVEDDVSVRRLVVRVLESEGFQVTAAESGEDALRRIDVEGLRFDLLVTDLVMPGIGGVEVAEAVRELLGPIPILFMSGYADEVMARVGVTSEDTRFLAKPFTPPALVAAARGALQRHVSLRGTVNASATEPS